MLPRLLTLLVAIALASACSASDGTQGSDASFDASYETSPPKDASTGDVAACGPVDVSSYQPEPLTPPNPPHQSKCSEQEVGDYAQCQGAKVTSLCHQFEDGQPAQTCRQCIETQKTDPRWGPLVFVGSSVAVFNVEGCIDDALGQVQQEKASGGSGSCGDLLYASYGCQDAACDACTGDAFDACVTAVASGSCKAYDAPVESSTGACAAIIEDAAPPEVSSCIPDSTIVDPTQQEVDWLQRIVGYMCGS